MQLYSPAPVNRLECVKSVEFPFKLWTLTVESSRLTTAAESVHTHTHSFPPSSSRTALICYSLSLSLSLSNFPLNTLTQKHQSPDKFHVSFRNAAICHCPALAGCSTGKNCSDSLKRPQSASYFCTAKDVQLGLL